MIRTVLITPWIAVQGVLVATYPTGWACVKDGDRVHFGWLVPQPQRARRFEIIEGGR